MPHLFLLRRSLVIAVGSCVLATASYAGHHNMEVVEVHGHNFSSQGLALQTEHSAASRLGLAIKDIPASVSIIDNEAIAIKGDFSGVAAVTRAPGFASSASPGNGGTSTSVRGFNGHSSVVYTYDGTRLYVGSGTVSFPADTWTVEQVEVLRGLGSVINGVGAIGATVNYAPKKPSFATPRHEIDVTVGSFDLQRYALGSGGELNSQLAYRVDAVNHSSNGYFGHDDEERSAVAGALLFKPREDLELLFSVDYANTDASSYQGTPLVNGRVPDSIRKNNYNVADSLVEYEDWWPRLQVKWNINDHAQLRSETYYLTAEREWRNVESYAYDPLARMVERSDYLHIKHEQEQLGNRSDLLLDWQMAGMKNRLNVGFDVNKINFSHINNAPYEGTSQVDLYHPVAGQWSEGVISETTRDYDSEVLQYSLFVDSVLELNERWQLVAGARHDVMDYERVDVARSNGQPASEVDGDLSGTSWRLGGVYQPNDATSFYAQYSTAVDAIQSLLGATDPTLDLAEGKQIEVGVKQKLWDGRLQYTLSLFDITKTDLLSRDPSGVQRQIGEQTSRGIELEVFWRPLDQLSVDFNVALTDADYEEFVSGSDDFSGKTPRSVPEKTANLWLTWQFAHAWSVAGGARYVGERYLDHANTSVMPDYTVFDATLQWQFNADTRLTLRGKNLSDTKDYILSGGSQWILAEGRSVEVGVHYGF